MISIVKCLAFVGLLASCAGETRSLRHRTQKSEDAQPAPVTSAPAPVLELTRADLRPLSRIEIQNSLQDVLNLPATPELENFLEQSSRSQIFRNSYDILNDSSSLNGLARDIRGLLESMDLRPLAARLVTCEALESEPCRKRLVLRIASHAWRRPLTSLEETTLTTQAAAISTLPSPVQAQALAQLLAEIFFDPRFLFRSELGAVAPEEGPDYSLAAWEKLTAISYGLMQRPPSWEHIQKLQNFEAHPERFQAWIDELLRDQVMGASLANMISEWLMYYGLENMDIQGDASWTRARAQEQMEAARAFIVDTFQREDNLRALITQPNPENQGFGIFSSKAFLTSTSKNGQGSMILRGVRIIRNALCQPMGVPPGTLEAAAPKDLSPLDPNYDIKLTLMHGSRPDCAACHRQIDPAGLALHTFNGFGSNVNTLVDFTALGIPSHVKVGLGGRMDTIAAASAREFAESMARSQTLARCFSRNAVRYMLGRDLSDKEISSADLLADQYLVAEASKKESLTEFFRAILSVETIYMRTR